jgi:hypothetical protein
MSRRKQDKAVEKKSKDKKPRAKRAPARRILPIKSDAGYLEVTLSQSANEQTITAFAKVTRIEDEIKPLAPDEFRAALERINALGLTWSADRIPLVKPKDSVSDEVLLSDEFEKIQRDYPYLPAEMNSIVFHTLTGSHAPAEIVGSQDYLEKKVAIVKDLLITPSYRSEFFFRHATKVPYLTDIDWEVVFKLGEKNVKDPPAISYALLSLKFLDPSRSSTRPQERTFTVAIDDELADGLIEALNQVKDALEQAKPITEAMMRAQKERDNGNSANKERRKLE